MQIEEKCLGLLPNGQIAISAYGMSAYFSAKKKLLAAAKAQDKLTTVKCGFDIEHNELIVTFFIDDSVETIAFLEDENIWVEFLDYKQTSEFNEETGADSYGSIGDVFVSFKDDVLYVHDSTEEYNNFYGSVADCSITAVSNENPIVDKHYKELSIDSTTTYGVEITTPITSTRTVGHKTYLKEGSFRDRQGSFVSPILRNVLVADGEEDMSLILNGDRVVGKFANIKLTKTPTDDFSLYDIGVTYLVQG